MKRTAWQNHPYIFITLWSSTCSVTVLMLILIIISATSPDSLFTSSFLLHPSFLSLFPFSFHLHPFFLPQSPLSRTWLNWPYFNWRGAANSVSSFSIINTLQLHWLRWTRLKTFFPPQEFEKLYGLRRITHVLSGEIVASLRQKPQLAHYDCLKLRDHMKWGKVISFPALSNFSEEASRTGSEEGLVS